MIYILSSRKVHFWSLIIYRSGHRIPCHFYLFSLFGIFSNTYIKLVTSIFLPPFKGHHDEPGGGGWGGHLWPDRLAKQQTKTQSLIPVVSEIHQYHIPIGCILCAGEIVTLIFDVIHAGLIDKNTTYASNMLYSYKSTWTIRHHVVTHWV